MPTHDARRRDVTRCWLINLFCAETERGGVPRDDDEDEGDDEGDGYSY